DEKFPKIFSKTPRSFCPLFKLVWRPLAPPTLGPKRGGGALPPRLSRSILELCLTDTLSS
ncbi:hypothetical protein E3U27_15715, partial [Shigella sonnei]